MSEQSAGAVQSVLNALRLLEVVGTVGPVGVSELAREVSLPKSSVQRALRTLQHGGWVRPTPNGQARWELTARLLALSLKAFSEYSLREYAEPAMRELRRRTGETIHLITLDGDEGLIIHRLDCTKPVRAYVEVGSRSPLHATASGQAILAFLPEPRRRELLEQGLEKYTSETVTDPTALEERLRLVRQRGYAVNLGAWRAEVASISAPILNVDGYAFAAMTISIPINRYSEDITSTYGDWAVELAAGLAGLER